MSFEIVQDRPAEKGTVPFFSHDSKKGDSPRPFSEFGLAPPILRAIVTEGYTAPTPIQSQAIPHVVAGRDLLGCAQTGTGKTAAFALPILHRLLGAEVARSGDRARTQGADAAPRSRGRRIRVLVLSPTRELAAQIGDSFRAYGRHTGLRHTVVFGGVNQRPQVRDLQRGVDILIATPGRLLDLMNQGFIDLAAVEIFVLDEADRMLDMGFLPDLRRVIAKLPSRRQTLLFSATMPEPIQRLADSILRDPVQVRIAPVQATTDLIEQSVCHVTNLQKPQKLANFLTSNPVTRAIVFTRTKHRADRVTRQLNQAGVSAAALHGDKTQAARQRALAGFKSNRAGIQVLVATDVAARGIDVEGVSHVLNYDLPHEPEMYVHRIGRTGRAGVPGIAVSFCDHEERPHLQAIERLIRRKLRVETDSSSEAPRSRDRATARVASPTDAPVHEPPEVATSSQQKTHPRRGGTARAIANRTKGKRTQINRAGRRRNERKRRSGIAAGDR
jgi:ATP-dependent RNA helicase RhlE